MLKLSQFATNRSGTVAVAFSLAIVPALVALGAAVDYSRYVTSQAALQAAVDSSVLAAGLDLSGATDAQLQTRADAAVRAAFRTRPNIQIDSVTVSSQTGNIVVRVASHTATAFGGLVGASSFASVTTAAVPKRTGVKMDVDFLLDASASMGLAASAAGRDQLHNATGCAFACHILESGQTVTNLQVARNLGILTRLDVLKNAVGGMIAKLSASKRPLDTYRVAIDTFDDAPSRAVPVTTDLASAQNYIQNYQLGNNTSFSNAMPFFNGDVGTQGNGVAAPKKFAIVVTDGVQGRRDRVGGFHPFDSRLCDSLKGQGVTVMVLNTKYVPMPAEPAYQQTVAPIQNQLEPALQACASTGYYFSATDQAEIDDAFAKIFNAIEARLRLVQ